MNEYPGFEYDISYKALKDKTEATGISKIHLWEKGICIQAGKKPAIAEPDDGFNQYYTIADAIDKILFKPHEMDFIHFLNTDKEILRNWFYKFHKNKDPLLPVRIQKSILITMAKTGSII